MQRLSILAGTLLFASVLPAQSSTGAPQSRVPTAADSALVRALDLPRFMQRARAAGAPDSTLRGMIDAMRRRGIPVQDAAPAVETEVEVVEQGGNKDAFGQFVKSQVEAGYRGRELADRIHAERARRGMGPDHARRGGRPEGKGPNRGGRPDDETEARSDGRGGRPDQAEARSDGRGGRPDEAGARSEGRGGRPEGAGARPDGRGGRADSASAPPVTGRPAGSARPRSDSTRGKPAPGSVRRP